ncbi:MAG: hypothetical protein KGJ09_07005 [Candidatus Omnitrophica bacterium]|nr:hypothetical protein [Candidatus Omnitrophota bacterium]MDE2009813.1 hypothetical protein [Candidatus Omnitrophota bacterium]MDE2215400.1 hypothetical protein [Candidatus Omnitrophota bacterium]MDE2231512.1 hypothetical protein [Candidatus Omnitrophota bacterium]
MSLKVYFKIASFVTIIALLYIHMQTKIFELSYKDKDKEKIIHELNDSNGVLDHQILTLRSANNLGNLLLDHNSGFQFMDNQRVMTVAASAGKIERWRQPQPKNVNPVWDWFSFFGAKAS